MKVLILSCTMGEGHNSAAYALDKAIKIAGHQSCVMDVLTFGGKNPPKIAENSYRSIVTKVPRVFGAIYKAGDAYNATGLRSPVYLANMIYSEKLRDFIIKNEYSAVVATHLFAMHALTHLRNKHKDFNVKCYGVLTDYTCIPFFNESKLDMFFVPHKDTATECIKKGMDYSHIYTSGIPVSPKFNDLGTKAEARNRLGIGNGQVFVVMTGGLGCGNAVELCKELVSGRPDAEIYVLYGRNEELGETVRNCFKNNLKVHDVAFTSKVNLYMNSADVLLSKPGGISSTEAAVINVPLVHTMPIPGCESRNAELFERTGMAFRAESPKRAAELAIKMIDDKILCERMRKAQRTQINPYASRDIAAYVLTHDI